MSFDMNNNRYGSTVGSVGGATFDEGLRQHMLSVYNYMAGGVALSGVIAWLVGNVPELTQLFYHTQVTPYGGLHYAPTLIGFAAIFAPLLFLVFGMGQRAFYGASVATLQGRFWIFAGLMGLSLSNIVLAYTQSSVAEAFFISAGMFAATSLFGYTTKRDLTGVGHFVMMGLFGLILVMLVNAFIGLPGLSFAISIIGVLVFVGLTAYDTQQIKETYAASWGSEVTQKLAIFGALRIYLDFINMFQFILALMGNRRN